MNKKELVTKISRETGITLDTVAKVINGYSNIIVRELSKNGKFKINDIGTISLCTVRASRRFDISKRVMVDSTPYRRFSFSPCTVLKETCKNKK